MKHTSLILLLAAGTAVASIQTSAQPATSARPAATSSNSTETGIELPPGVPPAKGDEKTIFTVSLRYQDIKIGTGEVIELNALNKFYGSSIRPGGPPTELSSTLPTTVPGLR